ncbi:MAG: hypothetical protein NTW47_16655 [Proteobacteria bacterium]|nr:hypothetical protein [Pseudomonadota bacterium]
MNCMNSRDTVAGIDRGTRARLIQLRRAAGRDDHRAGGKITPRAFRKIERKTAGDASAVVLHHVGKHMKIADTDAALVQLVQHHFGDAYAFVDRAKRAHERATAGHRHVIFLDLGAVPRETVAFEIVGAVHRLVGEYARQRIVVDADARIHRVPEKCVGAVGGIEARHCVVAAARHPGMVRSPRPFGEQHDFGARIVRGDRRPHARRAAAGDQHVDVLGEYFGFGCHSRAPT